MWLVEKIVSKIKGYKGKKIKRCRVSYFILSVTIILSFISLLSFYLKFYLLFCVKLCDWWLWWCMLFLVNIFSWFRVLWNIVNILNLMNIVIVIFCNALACFFELSILSNISQFTIESMNFRNFLKRKNLSKCSHRPTWFVIPVFSVISITICITLCVIIGVCL